MRVNDDVLAVLDKAQMVGRNLCLGHLGQLDRKLYVDVNKVLEAAGGKWHRGEKAHIFEEAAADVIEPIINSGEYQRIKQDLGQFDTPDHLAELLAADADIMPGHFVLEPSAGLGRLVAAAAARGGRVKAFELDPKRFATLVKRDMIEGEPTDFLTVNPDNEIKYDRVLMNPPFARQVDIDHVLHAAKFVRSGGRLVSVMSSSVVFRDNAKARAFREWVDGDLGGIIDLLPEGSFAASGTMVRACTVNIVI